MGVKWRLCFGLSMTIRGDWKRKGRRVLYLPLGVRALRPSQGGHSRPPRCQTKHGYPGRCLPNESRQGLHIHTPEAAGKIVTSVQYRDTIFGAKPLEFNRRKQTLNHVPPLAPQSGPSCLLRRGMPSSRPLSRTRKAPTACVHRAVPAPDPTCVMPQSQPRASTFTSRTAARVVWRCSWRSWRAPRSSALRVRIGCSRGGTVSLCVVSRSR